jgi:alkylation response protein AidB-like acyl-CoA dehydrogenase
MRFQLTPQQVQLQQLVREVARNELKPLAARWDRTHEFPWECIKHLARIGVLGLTIPEAYGGLGGSWIEAVLAVEEVARACYQTAMALLGELGVQTQAIVHYGTQAQKQRYLPAVARGELMCAICMTEPDAGSDVGAITTRAVGDGNGGYIVNGAKVLISRADVAGVFVTYIRFGDVPGSRGVGAVLIDRDTSGLEIGPGEETLGGEQLLSVFLRDVRLGPEAVLVKDQGFKKLMRAFNGQCCLNAAISIGQAQGAFALAPGAFGALGGGTPQIQRNIIADALVGREE